MSTGPEFEKVEGPLIEQLVRMGWTHTTGSLDDPSPSGRESFREVLLVEELREALTQINTRDGQPWLDDGRISQAVSELDRIAKPRLMEANQEATRLLLNGCVVEGLPDWDNGRSRTIHYIDWERPENNTFRVINQFRVDTPGKAKEFICPDLVLFINGIPVVAIEGKSPAVMEPIAEAINQLRRYTNQRKASGEVDENEGNEKLFFTNQLLVATSFDEASAGTIGADAEHFAPWRDVSPLTVDAVKSQLGRNIPDARLSAQETLVAGLLTPTHLLDVIRHFTAYQSVNGRTVKIVCRYPQFRAVQAAIVRLQSGKTRAQDGEFDRRGGVVWHTQGSGKSLTMMFLVKKLRSIPALRKFKIVLVTDRTDLQTQLSETATATGETVEVGRSMKTVQKLLQKKGPGLVFAMIQKYRERDLDTPEDESEVITDSPVLNDDESILVLVDEAHRSHASSLHAALLAALPNCARIGFTGTPIIMGAKKRTHKIFGEFLDRYRIKESETDGATVPILYEGRSAEGAVAHGGDLDQIFDHWFKDRPDDEREAIKKKYATKGAVLGEAKELIAAKADDMICHYVEHIMPNGLKAQVVAYSRLAAIRYQGALAAARDKLAQEAEELDPETRALDDEQLADLSKRMQAAVRAARQLTLLKAIEFATVISPKHNDPEEWAQWSDGTATENVIKRFKRRLGEERTDKTDPLAFLCVKSMLLTGFDAAVEGVMYLDRPIKEAELLQAIARVNRTYTPQKAAGILVDYHGVANHLKEALAAYSQEDIEGALQSLADEIPKLRDRCQRTLDVFGSRGVDVADEESCIQLLRDEQLRAEFTVKLKQFLTTLDVVLPRPEALPFVPTAKKLGMIYTRARNRYREGMPVLAKSIGAKVRNLIDTHIVSLGIDPKVAPISITDVDFDAHVSGQTSARAMASEMEHAARAHIRKHMVEDPVHFAKLSERLEQILKESGENWEQLVLALRPFMEDVKAGRQVDDTGLDPVTEAPFFDLLKQEAESDRAMRNSERTRLVQHTRNLVALLRQESAVVAFWKNPTRQEELRGQVFTFLTDLDLVAFDRADAVADRLMELAKANRHQFERRA